MAPQPTAVGSRDVLGCERETHKHARGRTIFVADAHRGEESVLVVHADEKRTAFVELESAIKKKNC
jgi:hypothetical protein